MQYLCSENERNIPAIKRGKPYCPTLIERNLKSVLKINQLWYLFNIIKHSLMITFNPYSIM